MGYRKPDGTWHDTCLDKVKPGEPIFVLRAQDRFAPALIRQWAVEFARQHGFEHAKYREAMETADAMEMWPTRKIPD